MNSTAAARLRDFFWNDPLMGLAISAALFAIATTPLAFAILGRREWFKARRGRVMRRPEFSSIVCAMLLVMGIPAIFIALVIKSQHFDKDRYEFDPNKSWSVLEQGRGYDSLLSADQAVKAEGKRVADMKKDLVDSVKKLDEAMLALRAVAGTSPAVAQALPTVLQRLAKIHASIGLDGPQQLMDDTAPPVALVASPGMAPAQAPGTLPVSPAATAAVAAVPTPTPAQPIASGLSKAQVEAEIASVPEPQKPLAAMLPLDNLPPEWTVGKLGEHYLETFNADNLFEKIDGRAESFVQYDVKGMAYANFHPTNDESNELQVYIFEMKDALKAFGKYGSEKSEDANVISLGTEGYTAAGSTLFHAGPYYTQIVSTTDDPKFSSFALELAKRIAAKQVSESGPAMADGGKSTPDSLFALLPPEPARSAPKYVAQDVFGYSFLSDIFMADYEENGVTWQGFLRPYADAKEAEAVFDKYLESAKRDEADIKMIESEGADKMMISSNIGLVDVVFLKGNVLGGANGATEVKSAEAFARALAKTIPAKIPPIEGNK